MIDKIRNVQKKIGKISKDKKNPFFNSSYFDINTLIEKLSPILEEEGLTIMQPLTNVDGRPAISTKVCDDERCVESVVTLPDIQDPQKMGSCITYYRRYSIQSLFCLEAEDDDANRASGKSKKVSKEEDIEL
jgi:hypothetical protein